MADVDGIRLFPRIDQERVVEQFQIEETAKTDAVNDYPPSDDSSPSGVQNDVIQFFNEQLRKAKDSALGILSSLSNQRDGIDVDGTLRQIRDIPKNCKIQLDRIRAEN
jgi:Rad3-related DNA helicase